MKIYKVSYLRSPRSNFTCIDSSKIELPVMAKKRSGMVVPSHSQLIQSNARSVIPEIDECSSSSLSRGKGDLIVLEPLDDKNEDLENFSEIDYEENNPSIVISVKHDKEDLDHELDENPYQNLQKLSKKDSLSVHYRNDSEESSIDITNAKYEVCV